MHKHNGLAFFDYASGAPYLKMDMNKVLPESYRELLFPNCYVDEEEEHLCFKDAMFFSPHKFLGGVNTPGVLIIQQRCVRNLLVPSEPGGGSVLFVTEHTQNYVKNIESREESGTPDIIGGVRIGLSLLLREKIDHTYVLEIEDRINQLVKEKLFNIPNLHILSDTEFIGDQPHTPIYSFLISYKGKFFHPNFISALLNDLFGIQSRPGCSCASLFGQYLLGIPQEYLHKLEILTCTGKEIYRPGYTRLNFPYFYPQYLIDYIIFAIEFCTEHAFKFFPLYAFKKESGNSIGLIPEITIIGGFLFSLIWENQNRYCLPYYIFMLVYVPEGIMQIGSCIDFLINRRSRKSSGWNNDEETKLRKVS